MSCAQPVHQSSKCASSAPSKAWPYLLQLQQLVSLRCELPLDQLLGKRDEILLSLLRNLSPSDAAQTLFSLRDQPEAVIGIDWCVFRRKEEFAVWLLRTADEAGAREMAVDNPTVGNSSCRDLVVHVCDTKDTAHGPPSGARALDQKQSSQPNVETSRVSPRAASYKAYFANPEDASGMSLEAISAVGVFFDARMLAYLRACSQPWHRAVSGCAFSEAWRALIGKDCSLLTKESDPMQKYLQMANVSLEGSWLDCGTDRVAKERYRFSTALRETRCKGVPLQRSLRAVSHLGEDVKHSHGRLEGAVYTCYETFEAAQSREPSDLVNISSGVLDLRDIDRPRITGTWMMLDIGDPSTVVTVTTGEFEFVKIDATYNEHAGRCQAWRQKAGLPQSQQLYITEPL